MPGKFWTDLKVKELRRLYRQWTIDQIARYFGVSRNAVKVAASKNGIASMAAAAKARGIRQRGKPRPAALVEMMRQEQIKRWSDPELAERMRAHLVRMNADPSVIERRSASRRGYPLTPAEKVERDILRHKAKMTAPEIRQALGK